MPPKKIVATTPAKTKASVRAATLKVKAVPVKVIAIPTDSDEDDDDTEVIRVDADSDKENQPVTQTVDKVTPTIRNPPKYWLEQAKTFMAADYKKVKRNEATGEMEMGLSKGARKIKMTGGLPLWRDFVEDWRGTREPASVQQYLGPATRIFTAFHPQPTPIRKGMPLNPDHPKFKTKMAACPIKITSWDWLGDTDANRLLVVAYVLEQCSGRGISTITSWFSGLQAQCWSVPSLKESYGLFQSYAYTQGVARSAETAKQLMTAKERSEYATPLEFDNNGRLIQALTIAAGTDASVYADQGVGALKRFKRLWQNYALYRTATNGHFVTRPQSYYDVRVVKTEAEMADYIRQHKNPHHNFFILPDDQSLPLTIVMNHYKTIKAKERLLGVVELREGVVFEDSYVTKAVRDSFIAFPRRWLMQKMGEEHSMSSNTVSGSECLD